MADTPHSNEAHFITAQPSDVPLVRVGGDAMPPNDARLAAIRTHAVRVFGNVEKADRWLCKPNRALAGVTPVSLINADRERGLDEVADLLGRIEHGIFS